MPKRRGSNPAETSVRGMVPGEGFEPPTFGLQNRCTATVLTRPTNPIPVYWIPLLDGEKQRKTPIQALFQTKSDPSSG
jgi:hypothetical protein